MTRNQDIRLEGIVDCKHEKPVPVVDNEGKILFWKCSCGRSFDANRFASKDQPR